MFFDMMGLKFRNFNLYTTGYLTGVIGIVFSLILHFVRDMLSKALDEIMFGANSNSEESNNDQSGKMNKNFLVNLSF